MAMDVYSPTNARKNIYTLIKSVISNHEPIQIATSPDDGVVMVSKADWNAIQEQLYLDETGVLETVLNRMENESTDDFRPEDAL